MSKKTDKQNEVTVSDMRKTLKVTMNREIANLPNLIEQLPTEQRIDVVLKMMPFVLPKVDKVSAKSGEPIDLFGDWATYD